ncbi:UNVERIFIED_ORG: hypothetical protein GGE44_001990 [Rhizobium esperanzae]
MEFLLIKNEVAITYERIIHRCHYGFAGKRYGLLENFRQVMTGGNDFHRVEAFQRVVAALDMIEIGSFGACPANRACDDACACQGSEAAKYDF